MNALEAVEALRTLGVVDTTVMFSRDRARNSESRIAEARQAGIEIAPYSTSTSFRSTMSAIAPTHFFNFTSGALDGSYFSDRWPYRWRFGDYCVINHVVFRSREVHGDIYAFVSDWLLEWFRNEPAGRPPRRSLRHPTLNSRAVVSSLPHAVSISEGDGAWFRKKFGIPADATLVGRIGGLDQFSDPAAKEAVERFLADSPMRWFVGANTPAFSNHPRAIFLPALARADVHDFFSAIDIQLNGRRMGESFGLAIVEGLKHGVPTIAPDVCRNPKMDQHHIQILKPAGWLYCSADDVLRLLEQFEASPDAARARELVHGRFTRDQFASRLLELLAPTTSRESEAEEDPFGRVPR